MAAVPVPPSEPKRSMTRVRAPLRPAARAAMIPAMPPPTTSTSGRCDTASSRAGSVTTAAPRSDIIDGPPGPRVGSRLTLEGPCGEAPHEGGAEREHEHDDRQRHDHSEPGQRPPLELLVPAAEVHDRHGAG